MNETDRARSYWHDNLIAVTVLLFLWFLVAYVAGVFGIEFLNQYRIGKLGVGFWIVQQGSILVFVLIVLSYALWMDRLDRKHGVGDD